ncbi:flagellar biosynthetic protein FliO [Actinoplanes sp. NBC_00393]|uniref:FliO/MopB family protein n=1 Tax=Actinoplanes sp. NBC_00393 TaxID=2975953 RepID=UPI002E1D5CBA
MIGLVVQVVFSLLVVLFLMWGLARVLRRPYGGRGAGPLAVLNREQLSRGSMIAVVRVADRALVLGITEQQVSLLGETELDAFETEPAEHRDALEVDAVTLPGWHPVGVGGRMDDTPRTWVSPLEFLRDRTSRR